MRFLLQPCPGLADQVERGEFGSVATRQLLQRYVRPAIDEGADTLVLGCTHYAFLAAETAAIAGPSVTLIEPSEAIARRLAAVLPGAALPSRPRVGRSSFHTSGSKAAMAAFLAAIGEPAEAVFDLA